MKPGDVVKIPEAGRWSDKLGEDCGYIWILIREMKVGEKDSAYNSIIDRDEGVWLCKSIANGVQTAFYKYWIIPQKEEENE